MMIKAQEVYQELQRISYDIDRLISKTSDGELGDNIQYEDSAEGRMYKNEIPKILDSLESIQYRIKYLERPIQHEGYLRKNSRGRYELGDHEFTSGSSIEILVSFDDDEKYEWYITRIEHDENDYYAVGCSSLNLNGIRARVR